MKSNKHFRCQNCERLSSTKFKNDVCFCFGLVKKLKKPVDHYRFCLQRKEIVEKNDIMLEELYVLLQGLSTLLLEKRIREINK